MRKALLVALLLAFTLLLGFAEGSQEASAAFPTKPIKLIVYTGAGGAGDILARKFTDIASKYTDATFVVENKPGAGGIVTMEYVRAGSNDGYTLMYVTKSNIAALVSTDSDIDPKEYDWISLMQIDPEAVITNVNTGIVTWEQVVADAKAKAGKQLWLGPAAGGLDHVVAQAIWKAAGIEATWVPFDSGGKAKAALLGEQGVTYTGNPAEIKGKPDFRIAAVCAAERLPAYPDAPTFKELGVPGVEGEVIWRGFALKAGAPEDVLAWYNDLFEKVTNDAEWIDTYQPNGIMVVHKEKDEFNMLVAEDYAKFKAAR